MNIILRNACVVSLAVIVCLPGCGKPPADPVSEKSTVAATTGTVAIARTPSPPGARVFFISPKDGDSTSNPVRIEFGIEGMAVAAAGDNQPESGHHHLLIDTDLPELGLPIPADAQHKHFGDGSTSTEITLRPGQHTLRMLLADYRHIPHEPPVASAAITITVE